MGIEEITGVTVCHNTKEALELAITSVRRFHPDLGIVIIDGSDRPDPCTAYAKSLESFLTSVIVPGYNIGHGRGMCLGIDHVKTPYALIFDSDIEMLKSPILEMLGLMEEDTYGVGYIEKNTAFDGHEWGRKKEHAKQGMMWYLHPMFQLLNVRRYREFHPYVHHGAPCYLAMLDIHKHGLSQKILKEFPGLGHSSGNGINWAGIPREHVRHNTRGTRDVRMRKHLSEIDGPWEYNRGQV